MAKDRLRNKACKLVAIVGLRDEMARFLPGGKLLPLMSLSGKAIARLKVGPRTWLGEGEDFLAAYHGLHKQVIG